MDGRGRRLLPLALLLLAMGIAAMALWEAQTSARSHRATAEGLLADYGAFAAWSYRQKVGTDMATAFHQTLEPAHHGKHLRADGTFVPVAALWEGQLEAADTGCVIVRPGAPYYFRLAPDGELTIAGHAPANGVLRWIHAEAAREAASGAPREEERLRSATIEGRSHYAVFALVGGPVGSPYVYGFGFDPARYQPLLSRSFASKPLLPAALMERRGNEELLAVRVLSAGGEILYQSGDDVSWSLAGSDTLGASTGRFVVQATVRPNVAESLIIGGLPRSRLPFLAGLFLLAAALTAVASGLMRREGELTRLRADFVSSASHELRTPLAQIRLFVETLRLGRYRSETQREWILDNLDRETTRLTGLVENILHFARGERKGGVGAREPALLEPYLRQIVEGFRPLAASRRADVALAVQPDLAALVHAATFRQVVLNLLDNAVKYGPTGQTVRVKAMRDGPDRVRIAVEDEGPGIDPSERELIWEPYRRGARAVGSVAVGSGIGLAIVREIVRGHEGTVFVEPTPGGGARFVVVLPAALPPVDAGARDAVEGVGAARDSDSADRLLRVG